MIVQLTASGASPVEVEMARMGYTLPVFAVAAAKAALIHLSQTQGQTPLQTVDVDLAATTQPDPVPIPIQQVAYLDDDTALGITLSDPGDNLDMTRHTPIWAWVHVAPSADPDPSESKLVLEAGEGLGRSSTGAPAIYSYARQLFEVNLRSLLPPRSCVRVKIILPEGRQLAQRTSNAAFGIVDGLALLGTSGIAQPVSAADHLETVRQTLQSQLQRSTDLIFCLGANGHQVVQRLGISSDRVVQVGNWIGALLVEAQIHGATSVVLVGYHGKLVKVAGGIFNTSSHVADARQEILMATVAQITTEPEILHGILTCQTADEAQQYLDHQGLAAAVFATLAPQVSRRAQAYVTRYTGESLCIGTLLFDRKGQILVQDQVASQLFTGLIGSDPWPNTPER